MIRVAINGFGRIGRMVARALIESKARDFEVVAINDLAPLETNIHLLKWDSIHGPMREPIESGSDWMDFGFGKTQVFAQKNPEDLPWKELNVDIVLECSGVFTSKEKAMSHIQAGAKRVMVSAPSDGADLTVVYGVNHMSLSKEHVVVSNASCTTNCFAPVASVLHKTFGIERGYMTTIHAYTSDQSLQDKAHKDSARARAATLSIVPTTTGAAKAVGLVLPQLQGKCDGTAIRVPVANVSMIDFVFESQKELSKMAINNAMVAASAMEPLKGILAINDQPLVSSDFNHHVASSIFDVNQTQVIEGKMGRVLSWYDNEWGFSNRMIDLARFWSQILSACK
jgi:glyceraldehyde 3-phosphate dehydrogenase